MTHICTTKEGTEIYREPESHLTKAVTYRITRRFPSGWETTPGLSKKQVERIIKTERLIEPLKEQLI